MGTDKTIEGRIRYSKDALISIRGLANENPFGKTSITKMVGRLRLGNKDGYLIIKYTGREDIAKRLETYIETVNRTDKAMMATFGSNSKEIN